MIYALLVLVAILPAAFYFFYILAFDYRKPEPPIVLLLSALLGAIASVAIVWFFDVSVVHIENCRSFKEILVIGFSEIALPSEIAKWLVLCVFLSLNKFYDEYIDGIVYSVCLSMGFAGIFGAWFLSSYFGESFATLLEVSAITVFVLIPIHFITGTIMGYFLALARKRGKLQNHALALILPILINGILINIVLMIGSHWEYYFVVGVIFTISAMVVYSQIYQLLKLDGGKKTGESSL